MLATPAQDSCFRTKPPQDPILSVHLKPASWCCLLTYCAGPGKVHRSQQLLQQEACWHSGAVSCQASCAPGKRELLNPRHKCMCVIVHMIKQVCTCSLSLTLTLTLTLSHTHTHIHTIPVWCHRRFSSQVEAHCNFRNEELLKFNTDAGIHVTVGAGSLSMNCVCV